MTVEIIKTIEYSSYIRVSIELKPKHHFGVNMRVVMTFLYQNKGLVIINEKLDQISIPSIDDERVNDK